jgi:hypothetical protein
MRCRHRVEEYVTLQSEFDNLASWRGRGGALAWWRGARQAQWRARGKRGACRRRCDGAMALARGECSVMQGNRRTARRRVRAPADMTIAPRLDPPRGPARGPARQGWPVRRRSALLINPFYAKDPRASYGKHVLTPTLALTSIAGATPPHWDVRYWDENLLQVIEEIVADGQPYVVFVDNNLGSRPDYLRRLCAGLRPLGIIWSAAVTIDITDDAALVRDMALAGCTGVFVGFESLNGGNLIAARKRTPVPEDYSRRVAMLHRYGIQVNGSFVLGFDHDEPNVFERTVEWIEANRLECATFHILTPYPGTPLFRQFEAEGRILHRDWDRYDTAHVVFQPKHMSCEELDDGYAWCYDRLFSHRSIWRRRPADHNAVLAYMAMSYLYKRSNRFWHLLIKRRLTGAIWRPLIEHSRRRHLELRARLEVLEVLEVSAEAIPNGPVPTRASQWVSPGV